MSEIVNLEAPRPWALCETEEGIFITKAAHDAAWQALQEEEDKTQALRLGVRGGGCSGFMYNMEFTKDIDPEEDIVRRVGSIDIVVDELSVQYLKGVILDHVKTLKESGFKFINKKPGVRHCGCGSSFSG